MEDDDDERSYDGNDEEIDSDLEIADLDENDDEDMSDEEDDNNK